MLVQIPTGYRGLFHRPAAGHILLFDAVVPPMLHSPMGVALCSMDRRRIIIRAAGKELSGTGTSEFRRNAAMRVL